MGGDICGYGWGDRKERRTVDVKNYRDRQTYYGAVDLLTEELLIQKAKTADGTRTVNFVKYLQFSLTRQSFAPYLGWSDLSSRRRISELFNSS